MAYPYVVVWREKGYNQYFKYFYNYNKAKKFAKEGIIPSVCVYGIVKD